MSDKNGLKSIFLFHPDLPTGEMFNLDEEGLERKLKDGWVDTPAKLDLPKNNELPITEEQAKQASPEELIQLLKDIGFIVLTEEQLIAEANKMASVALDIGKFSDEALLDEFLRRDFTEEQVEEAHKRASQAGPSEDEKPADNENPEDSDKENPGDIPDPGNDLKKQLFDRFQENPEALTKEELIMLGSDYDLSLRMNMLESTMIEKINSAVAAKSE